MLSLNCVNCWEPLRADRATTESVKTNVTRSKICQIGKSAAKPLGNKWKVQRLGYGVLRDGKSPRVRRVADKCLSLYYPISTRGESMSAKPQLASKHDLIIELASSGKTALEIADALGATRSGINKYAKKHGIEMVRANRTKLETNKDSVIEAIELGLSAAEIANKFSATTTSVRNFAKKHGVEIVKSGFHKGYINSKGYKKVRAPEHPRADSKGYIHEHTLVMEEALGRKLESDEVVHHINGVKNDNALDNLRLMSKHDHKSLHAKNGDCGWGKYHATKI